MSTSPESTATTPPIIGELRVCVWTGSGWHDYGLNFDFALQAIKLQHEALDSLLAKNVMRDPTFMPSEQPEWSAVVHGSTVIKLLTDTFMRPIE